MQKDTDQQKKQALRRLFAYLPKYRLYIFLAMVAMVMTAGTSSMLALLMGKLTDLGFYQKNGMVAIWAPLALIGISVLHGGGQFCSTYLLQKVSQSILVEVRGLMFNRMIHWPDEVFHAQKTGRIISRYVNEASGALSNASQILTVMVRDSLQVVALLCVLFWHNWQLTAVIFVVGPMLAVILRLVNGKIKQLTKSSQQTFGQMLSVLSQTCRAERLIKIYDAYQSQEKQFGDINRRLKGLTMRSEVVRALGTPSTQLVTMFGVGIVVFVALLQAQRGELSLADFVTYLSAMMLLMTPIRKLSNLNGSIAVMTASAESLFNVIDLPQEKDTGTRTLTHGKGQIQFRDVSFRYPGATEETLKNFSLDVPSGSMVALVGHSGAGKTTVINLLPRFYEPTSGEILFDGVPQKELTLQSIRSQISLVTQDVVIFSGTIAENIAFGATREVSDEEILKVAEAAYLMPLINSLPDGIHTHVGESGANLSGGQKQRISIARALLKNAPILLLDEATSALDTESEKFIQSSLERLLAGRTSFVVAHRLSTVTSADIIVVMEEGGISEVGTHEELLKKQGVYARLYAIQFNK